MTPYEAMITRRTVQRFSPGVVPDEVLERALRVATFAPNHKLTWPWRFLVIGPTTRARLAELSVALKTSGRTPTADVVATVRSKMMDPHHLVVVVQTLSDDPTRRQEDYATCACAIQNLSLSVHADGFHSKWSSGKVTTHPDTYALLGVDASTERVVGFVFVGQAATVPAPAPRPDWRDATRTLD